MSERDDQRTIDFFTARAKAHTDAVETVNWGSAASQARRFRVLADAGITPGARVLDVGCGLGDFYEWFRREGIAVDYHGVDITPALVERARVRHPGARFDVGSVLELPAEPYDFVLASGIFYLREEAPFEFMMRAASAMFARSSRGAAFNTLSTWGRAPEGNEFRADPVETLAACRALTERVTLRHDYHPGDFTIYLLKPNGP